MMRATVSRDCPASPTLMSFQARQHPSRRSSNLVHTVFHTSSICRVNFNLRFSPRVDPPLVSMPDVVKGFYMQPVEIRCSVESPIPYKLRFTRDGITVGEEKLYQ